MPNHLALAGAVFIAIAELLGPQRASAPAAQSGRRYVFGGVAGAIALVSRVLPLAGDAPVSDRWILRQADDRARLLGGFHLGHLDAHDALIQECRG